jgi:HAT1-interacting factor 1
MRGMALPLRSRTVLTLPRFPGAVTDFRAALALKEDLHPEESEIIAEAHFKLSLALEFASITRTQENGDQSKGTDEDETHVDQGMRDEAVKELEAAIKSTKLKLQNKEVELAESSSPDDNDVTRAQIADVKEIVADMEGRVCCIKSPCDLWLTEFVACRTSKTPG